MPEGQIQTQQQLSCKHAAEELGSVRMSAIILFGVLLEDDAIPSAAHSSALPWRRESQSNLITHDGCQPLRPDGLAIPPLGLRRRFTARRDAKLLTG